MLIAIGNRLDSKCTAITVVVNASHGLVFGCCDHSGRYGKIDADA